MCARFSYEMIVVTIFILVYKAKLSGPAGMFKELYTWPIILRPVVAECQLMSPTYFYLQTSSTVTCHSSLKM